MSEKDPVLEDIGMRLQFLRKKLGIMQKDFAEELGISGGSLSEIEAGNTKPMFEVCYILSKKYRVGMSYLLFGLGEMFITVESESSSDMSQPDEYRDFLDEFLNYFRESPVFRYAMMAAFTSFLAESEHSIEKIIKINTETGGKL